MPNQPKTPLGMRSTQKRDVWRECWCGARIRLVVLPEDVPSLHDKRRIWISEDASALCYPDSSNEADAHALHEPVDG